MFFGLENTQIEVSELLRKSVEEGNLPASLMFEGPEYSSRMYAAMSLARYYGSDSDSTVVFSERNQVCRILASINLFEKKRNNASRVFLRNTLDCFLKQFHGAVVDSQSSGGKKKFSDAAAVVDLLSELDRVQDNEVLSFTGKLKKNLSSLISLDKFSSGFKSSPISIDQIRAIKEWCSTSSLDGKVKFVIIEGLENASVSASNSLLKLIEEPPSDTHFVLITSNRGLIPITINSRVRHIVFKPLDNKGKNFILNSIFVNPNDYNDLKSFFISESGINDKLLNSCAESIILKKEYNLPSLVKELESSQTWDRFYELLLIKLREGIFNCAVDEKSGLYLVNEIQKMISKGYSFNTPKRQIFDFVLYRIKEVLN